jgi:hypothetical protein
MSLIVCQECKREISDTVAACPHCGFALKPACATSVTKDAAPGEQRKASVALQLGIVFVPLVFGWFGLGKRYRIGFRVATGLWMLVSIILLAQFFSVGSPSTKPQAGLTLPSFGEQIVTFDKYQRLKSGMSYRQVAQIIGHEGEELSRNKIDGVPGVMPSIDTVMYQWINSNGSNMNAMFQNDKLNAKSQFGLR